LIEAYGKNDLAFITRIVKLFLDRLKLIPDIVGLTEYFFKDEYSVEEKALAKLKDPQSKEILQELSARLSNVENFVREPIEKVFKEMAAEKTLKLGMIIHPCRAAVSGRLETPPMYDVLEVLGKEKVLDRINKVLG
jgi:glutamyl-tRNA synthetase